MDDEKFLSKIQAAFSEQNYDRITRAYYFAKRAHEGQKRKSGDDYIVHPIAVAEILVDLGLDTDTVIAALLHDVIEDTAVTEEELDQEFGHSVVLLVEGVTKLNKLNFKSREDQQAEYLRRMFLAMSNDIRVVIIKLADRLHNMRTLAFRNEADQKRIATETLDIYAPIAARLGIAGLKGELEDLCLRYLHSKACAAGHACEKDSAAFERAHWPAKVSAHVKAAVKAGAHGSVAQEGNRGSAPLPETGGDKAVYVRPKRHGLARVGARLGTILFLF